MNILSGKKYNWLITGVAGFIGSNLLEKLLLLDQCVIGIDNFSSGNRNNLVQVKNSVKLTSWNNFKFIEGDIRDYKFCIDIVQDIDYVLHQAALGSVVRSIEDPLLTNESNIVGFLNILNASKINNIKSFIYAASSSTYGDSSILPKTEDFIGKPLSPYAVTKYVNELYADVFFKCYNFNSIGLRYFNVFGKRQDPLGQYSAVIPKWINSIINNKLIMVNGDGTTSRDFTHIENVVQANIKAAITSDIRTRNQIYNIAAGKQTSLLELINLIFKLSNELGYNCDLPNIKFQDFRQGDVKHSFANISKAIDLLDYEPNINIENGLKLTIPWIKKHY